MSREPETTKILKLEGGGYKGSVKGLPLSPQVEPSNG